MKTLHLLSSALSCVELHDRMTAAGYDKSTAPFTPEYKCFDAVAKKWYPAPCMKMASNFARKAALVQKTAGGKFFHKG